MAGHSKYKNIMHRKGAQDKKRAKIFSRLGREISVSVKTGGLDPESNTRLRSAITEAKALNMPKDNIERAISKSDLNKNVNYESLRYEGFGPEKIAVIVEALTDNKNRTASNVRAIFQKNGGNLGTTGVASHNFKQVGVIRISKKEISDEKILELAIDAGAEECTSNEIFHEVLSSKESLYKVKSLIEKNISNFIFTGIEWITLNHVDLNGAKYKSATHLLEALEEDDDVQNVFTNLISKDN